MSPFLVSVTTVLRYMYAMPDCIFGIRVTDYLTNCSGAEKSTRKCTYNVSTFYHIKIW